MNEIVYMKNDEAVCDSLQVPRSSRRDTTEF